MLQAVTLETRKGVIRSMLHLSRRAKGVFCASRMEFTRNNIQSVALVFLHSSARHLSQTKLQSQVRIISSSKLCISMSTTLITKKVERAYRATAAMSGPVCRKTSCFTCTCKHFQPRNRSERHPSFRCLAKAHQQEFSSCG